MKKLQWLFFVVLPLFLGCQKEAGEHIPPVIHFKTGGGYVSSDTTLSLGQSFLVGIDAENPEVNLTNFIIRVETDIMETFLDSGMNTPVLSYDKLLVKGLKPVEKWIFIIRDKEGKSDEVSLTIRLDSSSSFGNIRYIPSVEMTAQNGGGAGFYSLEMDSTFNLSQAFQNQPLIDLCYYYDFIDTDQNTIASPGANIDASVFPGENGLSNWTIRRTTRFKIADISEADFLNITNDSLLLVLYGQSDGNRKAKNLMVGDLFSFKNEDGKVGLFKVNSVDGTDLGSINVSIKVQE